MMIEYINYLRGGASAALLIYDFFARQSDPKLLLFINSFFNFTDFNSLFPAYLQYFLHFNLNLFSNFIPFDRFWILNSQWFRFLMEIHNSFNLLNLGLFSFYMVSEEFDSTSQ